MPHFKDLGGRIHFLDDVNFSHLLPEGSVQLTEVEELALLESLAAPPGPEQLAAARAAEIRAELQLIDERKVRALTDALLNNDTSRLQTLEAQAALLRVELAGLTT